MTSPVIEGQLNDEERRLLADAVLNAPKKPEVVVEVGTGLGGGSTLTFLRALHQNGTGHLWGVEADRDVYDRMTANLNTLGPEIVGRFTPLFGFSEEVLPGWIAGQKKPFQIDVAFLDGGNRPLEQIREFEILDPYFPVGARLFTHDAMRRKGKWLVPYISRLDNWEAKVLPISETGLMSARKIAAQPSPPSLRAARACLLKMRLQPIEVAAHVTPSFVIRALLPLIPRRLAWRLTQGGS
jgi:predicted O-methyltransferase YrrM